MVSANYDNVPGVKFREWLDDDEQEPSTEIEDAKLEEMYVDDGYLYVAIITDSRGMYFNIPLPRTDDWNDLVNALPRWD